MRIDLHCHSTHSDGVLSAANVAERAKLQGVEVFCLSDHDSCAGYPETLAAFPNAIRGVELSCTEEGRTVHILLYATPSSTWDTVEAALENQRTVRRERVHIIAERLAAHGAHFDADSVLEKHKGTVGRPHVAAELVRTGVVSSREEAFSRFLKDGGPGDVKVSRLSVANALELATAANARASLAHPHLQGGRVEALVEKHRPQGLSGLEVHYAIYPAKKRKTFAALAKRHNMVGTAGSDFHGEGVTSVSKLGVDVPDDAANELLEWLDFRTDRPAT